MIFPGLTHLELSIALSQVAVIVRGLVGQGENPQRSPVQLAHRADGEMEAQNLGDLPTVMAPRAGLDQGTFSVLKDVGGRVSPGALRWV